MHKLHGMLILAAGIFLAGGVFFDVWNPDPLEGKSTHEAHAQEDPPGKSLYKEHCLACHQKDGSGVSSMYPPLVNNPRVIGEKDELIRIVLEGQRGRIQVHGRNYNGVMSAYNFLSDNEIASLLTYIRQNFENDTSAVSPGEVKEVRSSVEEE